jgi:DNA-binding transcriptional ArsR family regulator
LEKEAESRGVTPSALINEILSKYVKRYRYFEQLGFLPMSKDVLRKWLGRMEERFLVEDSRELGSTIGREYISYFFHDVNKDTLLKFLDVWLGRFESYKHEIDDRTHWLAVSHGINMQYSIHMKEFLKSLIEPIISEQVKFVDLTPNMISFSFEI